MTTAPADFAGRNIPDLSANADPDAGYTCVQHNRPVTLHGGPSCMAPRFAGTAAPMIRTGPGRCVVRHG